MADASLSTYWQLAGDRFGFRAITPYLLSLDKAVIAVDALLPDFGAPNGMLLVTDYDLLKPHLQEIQSAGYGFSVLTAKLADPVLLSLFICCQTGVGLGQALRHRGCVRPNNSFKPRPLRGSAAW